MAFGTDLAEPYFSGAATSVDTRWDVAIGGHGYMIDTKFIDEYGRQSVGMIRQQSDTSGKPGESSLNPQGLWRRAQETWHHGAGQEWLDRDGSDPFRFHTSKGIDPWTEWGLSLLPATASIETSTDTNLFLAVAGGRLYMSEGVNIRVTGVGNTTFADATGEAANTVTGLASDGTTVYAGFGLSGIYTATATAFASYVTGTVGIVRHVMGRLMCVNGPAIYNPVAAGALPAALHTHPNASWTWTDFGEGQNVIYASGYAGDKSMIYRIGIGTTGTSLDVPIVAATLPDGELAQSVTGYLGGQVVVIGTDKGVRIAAPNQDGSLQLGALITTGSPVLCAEGQDRFVWYGLTNYDGVSSGLGRLDLTTFTADLTPAYATDLMATAQGSVQSVVTYLGKRVFTVSGVGVFYQQDTDVASGTLATGKITYGIPDPKTAVELSVNHDPLPAAASVAVALSADDATATLVGTSDRDGATASSDDTFALAQTRAAHYELTLTLAGNVTLRRVTLESDPSARRTTIFQVPLRLFPKQEGQNGAALTMDVQAEFSYLTGLLDDRRIVAYQEANDSYRVVLDDYTWRPEKRGPDFWTGTFIARLKEL